MSQPSASDFPPDIEWSPEDEASGLVTFMQAAAQGTRDSSEDKTTAVCEALYAANPEAVARGLKIMTGCEPDDEEQDTLHELIHFLKAIAPRGLFEDEPWYTTQLGSSESLAESAAEEAALTASHTSHAESPPAQSQAHAGAGGSEQPEINLLLQWGLSEAFPGEWDQRWTTREKLQDFLVSDLKQEIHGYDETARVVPGFDGMVVNWADLTIEEMMALYRIEIALELAARGERHGGLPPEYDEIKASLDRATELESLAGPIPLDDTEAYAAAFGIADAEVQRKHVQDQLAVIYEHLNIEMPENYLESRSTTELNYELYYRLNYDVPRFMGLDENEKGNRIGKFLREYHEKAQLRPEDVIDRLQGTYHQPDVLGFLFIMGLSIAFEPVDYVLTAVDVIQALSEGDTESAVGNFLLGASPFLNSKMDDILQPFFGRLDNIRLLPARAGLPPRHTLKARGFTDEMIDAFEFRGATGPGTGSNIHRRWEVEGLESGSAVEDQGRNLGNIIQDENANILADRYGYSIFNEPETDQLEAVGFFERRDAQGAKINSNRRPDYIIEGRPFDSYALMLNKDGTVPTSDVSWTRIRRTIRDKVPSQTNRLVIDLSNSSLTADAAAEHLSSFYERNAPLLEEVIFMKNRQIAKIWVRPQG